MVYAAYDIQEQVLEPQAVASVRSWIGMDEISEAIGRTLARVAEVLAAQGLGPSGPPFVYYHAWTEEAGEIEAGFPVPHGFVAQGEVVAGELPGGSVLVTTHVGPYEELEPAYNAIIAHAAHNGLELSPSMWESYPTSPAEEPGEGGPVTVIYWPLR